MPKIRPYISIDLETTGLDVERSQILQIGWVIDDGVTPRPQLDQGAIFIQNESITYGENYALGMNAWIFQELMKPEDARSFPTKGLQEGLLKLMEAIERAATLAYNFDVAEGIKRPSKRVQLAGKNVGNFDWPIIRNQLKAFCPNLAEQMFKTSANGKVHFVDHRFIDCGAVFFDTFGRNPGFNEINKLIGNTEITHNALDDAMDVVIVLRNKLGIKE